MNTKKVAAAIIRSGEEILLTRRKPGEKLAGYWEFPGGKIELIALEAKIVSGDLQLTVHDKADWVPLPDLLEYKLAPADIPIAEELIKNDRRSRRN